MRKMIGLLVAVMAGGALGLPEATCVKTILRTDEGPGWQRLSAATARKYGKGFTLDRDGQTMICEAGEKKSEKRGAHWVLSLNQKEPEALVVAAEALAETASGEPDEGFSLYLDVFYTDRSAAYGQTAVFMRNPKSGWQAQQVTFLPQKPIASVYCYLLFRNLPGRVKFRNARWKTVASVASFDGLSVAQSQRLMQPTFLVRDVAAGSGFVAIQREALGLRLEAVESRRGGASFWDVQLTDQTGRDRAVTLAYIVPLGAGRLVWMEDPRHVKPLEAHSPEAASTLRFPVGAERLSIYPFGAVTVAGKGLALGLDLRTPAYFRTACNAASRELFIAFDFGLAPEKKTARVSFCAFTFDAANEFRGALAAYAAHYPDAFRRRIARQGLWMPFTAIRHVKGWEDFGFRFMEGDSQAAWDDAHDILTFRYTEPMTWWMPMKSVSTREAAEAEARRRAAAGLAEARAWLSSAFQNEDGMIPGRIRQEPWCNGIVWSINSAPGIAGGTNDFRQKGLDAESLAARYAEKPPKGTDGEYIDSTTGWVTDPMDFRRDHFAAMTTPLCFSSRDCKVGIYKGMIAYEYIRTIAEGVWPRGRFTMGNGSPSCWCWLSPWLDVQGTETDWVEKGQWHPMNDSELLYRRALCGSKPYCFLMNTDFSKFTHEMCEKYMRRCLAYGMFPGFFSADASSGAYFTRPELYERDRSLFKKYVPLCQRVAEAGWEPLTGFTSNHPHVILERFGSTYLTVFNVACQTRTATLRQTVGIPPATMRELVTGGTLTWHNQTATIELGPEEVRVLQLRAN